MVDGLRRERLQETYLTSVGRLPWPDMLRGQVETVGPMPIRKMMVLLLLITTAVLNLELAKASDLDTEPYVIYINPVTGEYTKTPPSQSEATKTEQTVLRPAQPVFYTRPAEVIVISGSLLFLGHLLAVGFGRIVPD